MVLERLAISQNRRDELPNIELAESLVEQEDKEAIEGLVKGLKLKKEIANDCIKVLYEIGERNPLLIAEHVHAFLDELMSRNNRMVWGAMTALATIAEYKADEIYAQIDKVNSAYKNGSVITVDNSISVIANLGKNNQHYRKELFPFLITHLETCRPKEVAQHAERISVCVDPNNFRRFQTTLENRKPMLTSAQTKRIDKLLRSLNSK